MNNVQRWGMDYHPQPRVRREMITCDYCGHTFNPASSRWLCLKCGMKMSCCEGDAL